MNLKGTLQVSTSLILLFTGFVSSFAKAEDYISTSQINVANKVAGLNTNKQLAETTIGSGLLREPIPTTTQYLRIGSGLLGEPKATFFENTVWPFSAQDSLMDNDRASSPNTIHFGGLGDHSDAYVNIIGNTMGLQDNTGAILSVQDVDSKYTDNRNGAGVTDAVVQFTKTINSGPRLKAGAEITNSDDKKRTVTITQTGFEVSPAFTEEQMKTIRGTGRIRVYTNWKHGNILSKDTIAGLNDPTKELHGLDNANVYFGYLDPDESVTDTASDKTIFTVYYDNYGSRTGDDIRVGWRTSYNPESDTTAENEGSRAWEQNIAKKAPGLNDSTIVGQKKNGAPCSSIDNTTCFSTTIKDSIDNIKDGDTNLLTKGLVWSYSTPAVFIGMADKKFLHNDAAYYNPGKVDSLNEVTRNQVDSITRSMVGVEYDLEANSDHDYQYQIHGIMMDANGHGHKLTSDSMDMYLGGDINHHLVIGDACTIVPHPNDEKDRPATPEEMNYAIETNGFSVMAPCPTREPNSGYNMAVFRGNSIKGERVSINIANLAKEKVSPDSTQLIDKTGLQENGWLYNVPTIMATIDPNEKNALKAGAGLAGIKWKQDEDTGSISLCGGSFAKNCGLTVTSSGSIKITSNFVNPLLLSAAGYDDTTKTVSGQGAVMMWNRIVSGGARTEFINIDPTAGNGGFDFYNINTTNKVSDKEPLLRLKNDGSFFNVSPTFNKPMFVADGQMIFFKNNEKSTALYLSLAGTYTDEDKKAGKKDTRGDLFIGTQVDGGANIRGVNGYYGKNLTVTQQVTSPKFVGTLSTPSSSSASCTTGEFKDDTNYHYVCVTTNKWRRVALSDF